jgi:hypothetical protein
MKYIDITGVLTWISSGFIMVNDIMNGWFCFKALSIRELLEILILLASFVYLVFRIIYERKKIRHTQLEIKEKELEIDDFEEAHKHNERYE